MRKRLLAGAVLAVWVAAPACNPDDVVKKIPYLSTMTEQRAIKPYARPIPPVEGTVPVTGGELPVTRDNADRLVNPRARTAESLNRGKWVYETYCLVCHGERGRGDGPIAFEGGGPFPAVSSLVDPARPRLSDGYLYGMVVDAAALGRGLMPRYGDRVRGADRWDLVNYIRSLQVLERTAGAAR